MKIFLKYLITVVLISTVLCSEVHEFGDHGHYDHHHDDHKHVYDGHHEHHDDHHNYHNDHHEVHHEHQYDHHEHQYDHHEHHSDHDHNYHHNNEHHTDHYLHHDDHDHHHDHHEDDLTPMQKKIRQMAASKVGQDVHSKQKENLENSNLNTNSKKDNVMKKEVHTLPPTTTKIMEPYIKKTKTRGPLESIKETNHKQTEKETKTNLSDAEKPVKKEKQFYKDHCHIKEEEEFDKLPANKNKRKLTWERAKKQHWWELGMDVMLQRFTVMLPYGDHCFHQPVLENSKFICFFKDYNREPLLATLFDSKSKSIHAEFTEHGNLTATPKHADNYHICFRNSKYYTRKLFVVIEIEPEEKMPVPPLVKSENRLSTWVRRIETLLQYRIVCSTIETYFQEEFLSIMGRRSICFSIATLCVLLFQVYYIHRFFDQPKQLSSITYRMGV